MSVWHDCDMASEQLYSCYVQLEIAVQENSSTPSRLDALEVLERGAMLLQYAPDTCQAEAHECQSSEDRAAPLCSVFRCGKHGRLAALSL